MSNTDYEAVGTFKFHSAVNALPAIYSAFTFYSNRINFFDLFNKLLEVRSTFLCFPSVSGNIYTKKKKRLLKL